ncbi:hypothetical protein OA92_21380 [Marinomonas sp. SBI22]|nr:hypothetical protein OA92_21380 [Marinomonas sp. SBI22]
MTIINLTQDYQHTITRILSQPVLRGNAYLPALLARNLIPPTMLELELKAMHSNAEHGNKTLDFPN